MKLKAALPAKSSLSIVRNGKKSVFALPPEIKKEFHPGYNFFYLVELFQDRDGALWITTNNAKVEYSDGKLFKFDGGKFEQITADGLPKGLVSKMAQDGQGNLWLGTRRDGAGTTRSSNSRSKIKQTFRK